MPGSTSQDHGPPSFAMPQFDPTLVMEAHHRTMRLALEAHGHNFRHMADIGTSVLEFVQRRLLHDADLARRLGAAKMPQDAYAACHDFVDTAIEEYSAEFTALATLYVDQTREALHDAERQVDEVARPMIEVE